MLVSIYRKLRFDLRTKRLGPDVPFTHWLLYFSSSAKWLIKRKMGYIGKDSEIRPYAFIVNSDKISIGDEVVIRPGSHIYGDPLSEGFSIKIGDKCQIGACVHMYVNAHDYSRKDTNVFDHFPPEPINIEEEVWIGANAVILPGVNIGKRAIVAAGAVVTKDVSAFHVAKGVPAESKPYLKE